MEATRLATRNRLLPLLDKGLIPVVTGFVAATPGGVPTVLGRGGSDYSAAILGAALDADEIQIWTDVDGVLTADPRIVKEARPLAELTYAEAAELAYFGAKVLHPKTMLPAIDRGIPISVRNTFNPSFPGTRVVPKADNGGTVKALTVIRGLALVTVAGRGMMGVPGIAARTFAAVAERGANVLMISQASSEQSICFVVPEADAAPVCNALERSFGEEIKRRLIDRVTVEPQIVIVAVVGEGMRGTPGIAARLFSALGEQKPQRHRGRAGFIRDQHLARTGRRRRRCRRALHSRCLRAWRRNVSSETGGRMKRIPLIIFGAGKVGRALVRQLLQSAALHAERDDLAIRIAAWCDRDGAIVDEKGLWPEVLRAASARQARRRVLRQH